MHTFQARGKDVRIDASGVAFASRDVRGESPAPCAPDITPDNLRSPTASGGRRAIGHRGRGIVRSAADRSIDRPTTTAGATTGATVCILLLGLSPTSCDKR